MISIVAMLAQVQRLKRRLDPLISSYDLRDSFDWEALPEDEQEQFLRLVDALAPRIPIGPFGPLYYAQKAGSLLVGAQERDRLDTWCTLIAAIERGEEDQAAMCRAYLAMDEAEKAAVYAAFCAIDCRVFPAMKYASEAPEVTWGGRAHLFYQGAYLWMREHLAQPYYQTGYVWRYHDIETMWFWLEMARKEGKYA
jgi:hypothetical protein